MSKSTTKLSQTKSAIARRKMRATETPAAKAARLARRREQMAKWRAWNKLVNESSLRALCD